MPRLYSDYTQAGNTETDGLPILSLQVFSVVLLVVIFVFHVNVTVVTTSTQDIAGK